MVELLLLILLHSLFLLVMRRKFLLTSAWWNWVKPILSPSLIGLSVSLLLSCLLNLLSLGKRKGSINTSFLFIRLDYWTSEVNGLLSWTETSTLSSLFSSSVFDLSPLQLGFLSQLHCLPLSLRSRPSVSPFRWALSPLVNSVKQFHFLPLSLSVELFHPSPTRFRSWFSNF